MNRSPKSGPQKAQAAIEYLVLFGVVAVVVLVAMNPGVGGLTPMAEDASNMYFNKAVMGIMGTPPDIP